ncbi:MAG: signal peptidase II [Desulfitobacteriaceae bacterium]
MFVWVTMIGILIMDRVIKIAIMEKFVPNETMVIIPKVLHLTFVLNPGAAFGLMAGRTWIFIITAVLVLIGVIYAQFRLTFEDRLIRLSMGMIGGGALGNLLDRVLTGSVIDYLDFRIWPFVFNFADSMIVTGVTLLLICFYRHERKTSGQEV